MGQRILLHHKQILMAMTASIALLAGQSPATAQFSIGHRRLPAADRAASRPAVRRVKPSYKAGQRHARDPPPGKVPRSAKGKRQGQRQGRGKEKPAALAARAGRVPRLPSPSTSSSSPSIPTAWRLRARACPSSADPTGCRHHPEGTLPPVGRLWRYPLTCSGSPVRRRHLSGRRQANPQGSIRLPDPFARQLWDVTGWGARHYHARRGHAGDGRKPPPFARRQAPGNKRCRRSRWSICLQRAYSFRNAPPAPSPRSALDACTCEGAGHLIGGGQIGV